MSGNGPILPLAGGGSGSADCAGMSVGGAEGFGELRGVIGSHWSVVESVWVPGATVEAGTAFWLDVRGKTHWTFYVNNNNNAFPVQLWIGHQLGQYRLWYEGPIPCGPATTTIVDRVRSCDLISVHLVTTEEEPAACGLGASATHGG